MRSVRHALGARALPLLVILRANVRAAVMLSAVLGCGDDPKPAKVVDPSFEGSCAFEDCSGNGVCSSGAAGEPQCTCGLGYGGARCDQCAKGYHFDSDLRCWPDRRCEQEAPNLCGAHGVCTDAEGVLHCACDRGYEGARCELCASGYAKDPSGDCLQVILPGGNGNTPQTVAPECMATTCGGHGDCRAADAGVSCTCFPGYIGARCESCQEGYVMRNGRCVANTSCSASACGACEGFDEVMGTPSYPNNCVSRTTLEMTDFTLSSLDGTGPLWVCSQNNNYNVVTPHVAIEAGPTQYGKFKFRAPIRKLSFDYASRAFATARPAVVELTGDGRGVDSITMLGGEKSSTVYNFNPPITEFGVRSMTSSFEQIAFDNLSFEYAACK